MQCLHASISVANSSQSTAGSIANDTIRRVSLALKQWRMIEQKRKDRRAVKMLNKVREGWSPTDCHHGSWTWTGLSGHWRPFVFSSFSLYFFLFLVMRQRHSAVAYLECAKGRVGIVGGDNELHGGWTPMQLMSTDAHFWVKIGIKFQSLGKISNISATGPPVLLGQFQHWRKEGPKGSGPSGVQGQSPGRKSGGRSPQKLTLFLLMYA